jgi:hypothetical protein
MDNWEGENIRMSNITIHPNYNDWILDNDFAVVILKRETTLDIKYPTLNTDHSFPSVDTLSTVIGWGATKGGSESNVLLETDLTIISNKDCEKCYVGEVTSKMICGFDLGHGASYGDSGECMLHRSVDCIATQEAFTYTTHHLSTGGPLIVPGTEKDVLIGLFSWVGYSFSRYPSVFARVSSGYNWMKRHICEASSAPPSDICDVSYAPTTAPSLSPTTSPTTSSSPTVVPVEGFSYVGEGYCLDTNNNTYSAFLRKFKETDYRVCVEWCAQISHPDFIGVEIEYYEDDFYTCWCDFSRELPEDIIKTDYEPPAKNQYSSNGHGSIENVSPVQGTLCYRYDVSLNNMKNLSFQYR